MAAEIGGGGDRPEDTKHAGAALRHCYICNRYDWCPEAELAEYAIHSLVADVDTRVFE